MMKTFTIKFIACIIASFGIHASLLAQFSFSNANSKLHSQSGVAGSNSGVHSPNTVIVVDIDNNGLDDIAKLDEASNLDIEYQQPGGTYTFANDVFVISSGVNIWGASMADVDHNGYKDFLYAGWGTNGARIIKLNATGTGNLGITNLPGGGGISSQNCNFMDINNDGWEDIFVCHDNGQSMIWVNDGAGNFPAEQGNGPYLNYNIHPSPGVTNDESGNYGSVWTDFDNDGDVDLYVAHCRQGQPSGDQRRYDMLFENNGSNVYTSTIASHGAINSDTQDWTSSFGDIDNDGDFDLLLTGHEAGNTNRIFLNDGNGNFTFLSAIYFGANAYESFMDDFDNDGWIDIIMTGSSAVHAFHRNNGDLTFTQVPNASMGISTTDNVLSAAAGDLNHDGKVDLYASYGDGYNTPDGGSIDVLYLNTADNSNNFFTLDLRGTSSTDGALGARAYIYGAWGVQTREVRASESYGNMNSFMLHFGLGSATTIDSVVIDWPALGSPSNHIVNPAVNQFLTVIEATCVSPNNVITYTDPVICTPGTCTLNAATGAGYSYLWSNGATTSSINVSTPGDYNVRITQAGNSCISWSSIVTVVVDPDETPTITAGGPTTFCPGGSVTLTSSESSGNTWSTSATTSSIDVTTAGTYTVDYDGVCQSWTSAPIVVTLLAAPSSPVTTDDYIAAPGTGNLTATGTIVKWFDAITGGSLVGTGSPFVTPFVSSNTTYYAQDELDYGGLTGNVGQVNHSGTDYNGNTYNGWLIFDVANNSTLNTVKVYTDSAANRTIELRDNVGTVINSTVVFIPAGTNVITLNFPLTPGTNYQLGTNSAANNAIFGDVSPILKRSTTSVAYPYTLAGGAVSITSSSASTNYYYFYDWNVTVDPTDACASPRTPATVYITNGIDPQSEYNISVYPNPTTEYVNVEFTAPEQGEAMLAIYDMLGKKVYDLNMGVVNGNVIKTINTNSYAKGVYAVKLTINKTEYTTKVVVK